MSLTPVSRAVRAGETQHVRDYQSAQRMTVGLAHRRRRIYTRAQVDEQKCPRHHLHVHRQAGTRAPRRVPPPGTTVTSIPSGPRFCPSRPAHHHRPRRSRAMRLRWASNRWGGAGWCASHAVTAPWCLAGSSRCWPTRQRPACSTCLSPAAALFIHAAEALARTEDWRRVSEVLSRVNTLAMAHLVELGIGNPVRHSGV